jgi:hypothetical protein
MVVKINKVNKMKLTQMTKYTTEQLIAVATQLRDTFTDESSAVIDLIVNELSTRLDDNKFIEFCDSL